MKKSLFFLIFLLSLQGAFAQRMRDVFASMPDSVLEVMTKNNRLDCIDFIENNMEARVRNRFDGFSELKTLTEDYLNLNLTSSCLVEMKLLPVADSISYICVVKTYSGPVRESTVAVYTDKWKLLPREKWIKWPEYNDFWQANDSITDVDIRSMQREQAMHFVSACLSADQTRLTLEVQLDKTDEEKDKKMKSVLHPLVYEWKRESKSFIPEF